MKIINSNLRNNFVDGLANKRRSRSYALEIPTRVIEDYAYILLACIDVYNSGIIFPQGGARAKRKGTPGVDIILADLADNIYEYFMNEENASISEQKFDEFHAAWCGSFLEEINLARASVGYQPICYGSAQKMINMVFKYLVCYDDYTSFADHFKWCHMPIDTVILKWLKDRYQISDIYYRININSKGIEELFANYKKKTWTSFDDALYNDLLSVVRKKIKADPDFKNCSILGVEFAIWA